MTGNKWARWMVAVLAPALACVAAQARASDAKHAEMRVEIRAEAPGEKPEVRVWVNGKEVESGEDVEVAGKGDVRAFSASRAERDGGDDRDRDEGRAALGVMIAPLDDETARRADVDAGAVVRDVRPGSAAEKAGLKEGDVITRFDTKRIETPQQLADAVGGGRPGDRVRLEWSRQGRRMRKTVTLGGGQAGPRREPRRDERPRKPAPPKGEPGGAFLGVMVASLTDEIRDIAGTDTGVLINSLTDASPAAKGGLQPGDVVTRVDDREVGAPEDLVEAVRAHKPGDRITIRYWRMGKRREARVTLGEAPGEHPRHKEGAPLSDLYHDLFDNMPQLRSYLDKLRPELREWAKRFEEQVGKRRPPVPAPAFPKPKAGPRAAPEREPYDVGKDMGRILERLERIEHRLDEVERRLQRSDR